MPTAAVQPSEIDRRRTPNLIVGGAVCAAFYSVAVLVVRLALA